MATACVPQQPLATTTNPPPEKQQQQQPPHFINYVTGLRNLSPALSAFHRRYDELHEHLDFIRTSIDAELLQLLDTDNPSRTAVVVPVSETLPVDELGKSEKQTVDVASNGNNNNQSESESESEIEAMCKKMCSRSLRKYIISHLSNVPKLREEVPAALKLAENPAKLVLECFGRFFLQGIKAYSKDSPMIPSRQASILVMEFFMLMGFDSGGIDDALKKEAESAAVEWRKRLAVEGGLEKACETDARGLLLLIGCFGIPKAFKKEDIRDLVRASHAIEISDALQRSNVLLTRIPEVIEWMLKNKMEVDAADMAYTFGMEKRFLAGKILKSFLRESKETCKNTKKASDGSFATVNKANRRKLADLKVVRKCLEDHKIDQSKVLPGWQINEKISKLETEIAELDKKIREQVKTKRKADEPESSKKVKSQEAKRTRFADSKPQQQNAVAYMDGKDSYDGLVQRNLLDGGIPQFSTYPAYSSVLHGAGAGSIPGLGASDIIQAGSYAGVHGGILVDRVGQVSNPNVQPYGWRGDVSYGERLVGHSFAEPLALGASSLYRAGPTVEGFPGLPNPSSVGVSHRSSTSDLYQFADTIVERDTYAGSRTGAAIPPRVVAAHPSSLYY